MAEQNVKLGVMPPLTGLVGIYGSEIVHAAQVACQEINENGGVLGRTLEIIIEDDGSLPDSAVIAAKKLLDEHKCSAIIGNLLSNSRIAVAYSVAEPRKVPYLNFSFYEGSISSPYFFHFAALPNQQIDKMIPYMRNKFGPRMFFAGNNYEWPRGSIAAGKLALEKVGGEVVGEQYTPIGVEPDVIEELLDRVEAANPDVFVPYFAGSDQVLLLTRFTERGMKDRIKVVMGHYDEMMASQLSAEVRDGFYSSNTYFMSIDSEENENYKSRLANLPDVDGVWPNGNGILTNFGEGTYVCVKAFAQAANQAGTLDPEALVEELDAIRIKAPQGLVEMNPEHHHAKVNTYLSRCDANGIFEIIEKFAAIEPVIPARYRHQKIANQATLEDDIRLQARILEQMTDGVILTSSADRTIVYTNTGAEKLFGYDKDEMVGLPIATINDSTNNNPHDTADEIMRILNQTGEWQGEIRNIKKDGSSIWCTTSVSTFTHPAYGEVWLAVHHDINEIKNNELVIRESEKQLKEAQRIAKVGGWELDLVGNHLKWTDETYHIFEADKEAFDDSFESFLKKVHPDDLERVEKAFTDSVKKNESYEIEHRIVMKDGRIKFVRETCETMYSQKTGTPLYSTGIVQDLTEHIEQENALKEASDLNEKILSESAIGLAIYNSAGQCITANSSIATMIGASLEQVLEQNYKSIVSWKKSGLYDVALKCVATEKKQRHELEIMTTFGKQTSFDCLFTSFLLHGEQHLLLMLDDISHRKEYEKSLLQSEEMLEKAQEIARLGHWKLDLINLEIVGSKEFYKLFGLSGDRLTATNLIAVIHEDDRDMAQAILQRAIEQGEAWDIKYRVLHTDGTQKWVHAVGEVIADESESFVQAIGTVQDVTELKETEQALIESGLWMESIYNSLDEAVLVVSPDRELLNINEAAIKMFGYSIEEIKSSSTELFHIDHNHFLEFGERIQKAFSKNEAANFEFKAKRKNDEIFPTEHTVSRLIDSNGKTKGIVSVIKDITERKKIEAELEKHSSHLEELVSSRTSELESVHSELVRKERLATLGQLTATVSHELRNPLGAMRPSLFIIEKKSDKEDERLQQAIARVDRNIDRCDRIIDELLDFTRITELHKERTRFDEWVESVIDEQIVSEGIQLEKDFSLNDVEMDVDTGRLRRAIINVFDNACHSMMDDNQKLVKNKNALLIIKTTSNENKVGISVTDTGSGISEAVLKNVFEPLYSTKGFGVGLGMPAVKQIMQQHGGHIDIKSKEGKGTTVTLWLPIKSEEGDKEVEVKV